MLMADVVREFICTSFMTTVFWKPHTPAEVNPLGKRHGLLKTQLLLPSRFTVSRSLILRTPLSRRSLELNAPVAEKSPCNVVLVWLKLMRSEPLNLMWFANPPCQVENVTERRGSTGNVAVERDESWLHVYSVDTVQTDNEVICVWIVE